MLHHIQHFVLAQLPFFFLVAVFDDTESRRRMDDVWYQSQKQGWKDRRSVRTQTRRKGVAAFSVSLGLNLNFYNWAHTPDWFSDLIARNYDPNLSHVSLDFFSHHLPECETQIAVKTFWSWLDERKMKKRIENNLSVLYLLLSNGSGQTFTYNHHCPACNINDRPLIMIVNCSFTSPEVYKPHPEFSKDPSYN